MRSPGEARAGRHGRAIETDVSHSTRTPILILLDRRSRGKGPGRPGLAVQQAAAHVRSLSHERGERADVAHSLDLIVKDIMLYKRNEDRRLMIDGLPKAGLPV